MCGFAGILATSARADRDALVVMARSLAHRGPDDEGIEILAIPGEEECSLGLVHRRLSIIDLSDAAHQPMRDEQTGNWIVYNGEIYNYQDVRRELQQRGCTFRSHSDTEVILKAYACFGAECLHRLRGMFALAIWDARQRQLFLAVDRFGIKPLYVYQAQNLLIFSSELRPLLKSGLIPSRIDPLGVESFLAHGAVQAPLTMVRDVHALLPAQYLTYRLSDRSVRHTTYWQLRHAAPAQHTEHPDRVIEHMREILADSVEQHLVSDVPVGLFLSGGIDSSAVVALANRRRAGALQSFSVTFTDERFSEQKYSDLIAKRYCQHHTRIPIGEEDLAGFLPGALEAMDQPTLDGVNVYTISQAVRRAGVKVVLSGQGGDEVFGGYPSFGRLPQILAAQAVLRHVPGPIRAGMADLTDVLLRQRWLGSKIGQLMRLDHDLLASFLTFRQVFSPAGRDLLLRERDDSATVNGLALEVAQALREEIRNLNAFSSISALEMRLFLANTLLRDGDFMSMAHGLEVRVPFLDHRIVEFVFGVPTTLKTAHAIPKPLLVRAMGDLLPKEIWQRRKMGFFFPWKSWLRQRLRPQIDALFHSLPEDNELNLNLPSCRTVWQKFLAGAPGVTWPRVWALYVLLSWYNRNMTGG